MARVASRRPRRRSCGGSSRRGRRAAGGRHHDARRSPRRRRASCSTAWRGSTCRSTRTRASPSRMRVEELAEASRPLGRAARAGAAGDPRYAGLRRAAGRRRAPGGAGRRCRPSTRWRSTRSSRRRPGATAPSGCAALGDAAAAPRRERSRRRLFLDCYVAARILGLGGCPARADLSPAAPAAAAFRSCVYQPAPDFVAADALTLAGAPRRASSRPRPARSRFASRAPGRCGAARRRADRLPALGQHRPPPRLERPQRPARRLDARQLRQLPRRPRLLHLLEPAAVARPFDELARHPALLAHRPIQVAQQRLRRERLHVLVELGRDRRARARLAETRRASRPDRRASSARPTESAWLQSRTKRSRVAHVPLAQPKDALIDERPPRSPGLVVAHPRIMR